MGAAPDDAMVNGGMRKSGRSIREAANGLTVRCAGTNASSTKTVLLPVPRIPVVCHVSRIVKSPRGSASTRTSGVLPATIAKSPTQSAMSMALTMSQRPDSR